MQPVVYAYKRVSESARLLAKALDAGYTYPDSTTPIKRGQVVINWGSGHHVRHDMPGAARLVNHPAAVARSVGKLDTFAALERAGLGKYIPEYTASTMRARQWINAGEVVYARQTDGGKAGKGIVIYDLKKGIPHRGEVTDAELQRGGYIFYSKGFKTEWEMKVHVAFGKAWLWWRVEKDRDFTQQSRYVRNYAEGYQFRNTKSDVHPQIKRVCERAIAAIGLDFGVVDIGIGKKVGELCIFETNTAPALDENDARRYAEMFTKELKLRK